MRLYFLRFIPKKIMVRKPIKAPRKKSIAPAFNIVDIIIYLLFYKGSYRHLT
ncbi:hypothetical protein AXX16_1923 [Serratia rubidaea]|nr:hypothetical protein AXX16_1923 [Serratia rubidaea]